MLMLTRCDRRESARAVEPRPDPAPVEQHDTVPDDDQDTVERADTIGHDGKLKVTLLWDFPGDVDLHAHAPGGGHIYFHNKKDRRSGGELDVDNINGGRGSAENIYWENPTPGTYNISVVYYNVDDSHPGGPVKVVIKQMINGQERTNVYDLNLSADQEKEEIAVKAVTVR